MNGTTLDDQIRFAVDRETRIAWQLGLRKRNLNGSGLLRDCVEDMLDKWHEEEFGGDAQAENAG